LAQAGARSGPPSEQAMADPATSHAGPSPHGARAVASGSFYGGGGQRSTGQGGNERPGQRERGATPSRQALVNREIMEGPTVEEVFSMVEKRRLEFDGVNYATAL